MHKNRFKRMQPHKEGITHEVRGKPRTSEKPRCEMLLRSTVPIQPHKEIMGTMLKGTNPKELPNSLLKSTHSYISTNFLI